MPLIPLYLSDNCIKYRDPRNKPRLRVNQDGTCLYSFTHNSWVVFDNIVKAYAYLKTNKIGAR